MKGMVRNHSLARAISDVGFFEFRWQLTYKAALAGADRWYPSSKTCSACGSVVEALPLPVRDWICPTCSVVHDRDFNAAKNLEKWAASSAVSACGEVGAGLRHSSKVKPASGKQELNSVCLVR